MQRWERAESSVGGPFSSSLNKDKMLNGGHLDRNSVQFCSDSLMERLKQTVLNQELVFMGQVSKLHQLYRIQIAMTEDVKQKGFGNCYAHFNGANSCPVNLNNQVKYSLSNLKSSRPGFKQKPLDLQLSADEFIRQAANDLPRNGARRGFPNESKNFFQDTKHFGLNHSLRIGEGTSKSCVNTHQFLLGKINRGLPPDIIDLEDPNSCFSNNNVDLGIPSRTSCIKLDQDTKHFGLNHSLRIGEGTSKSCVNTHQFLLGKINRGPPPDIIDLEDPNSCFSNNNVDLGIPSRTSCIKLDLNTIQLDDLSCFENSHCGAVNPVQTAFATMTRKGYSQSTVISGVTPATRRESNVHSCTEMPSVHVWNNAKLGQAQNFIDNGSQIVIIDLDSDSGEELCSGENSQIESVGSTSKLSDGLSSDIVMGPQPVVLSHFHQKSTVHSSLSSYDETPIHDEGPKDPHSRVLEQRSFESTASNVRSINSKDVRVDGTVQNAAELLVEISRQSKKPDRPQCSSVSYEAMVVNAKECGPDEYCISSNAISVVESEIKDNIWYKLKRGTRMKDFQKGILSSLSTLSRQEIREDLKIFEGVIKSREYKRMRAKMGDEGIWSMPTRSKRSRINRRYDSYVCV